MYVLRNWDLPHNQHRIPLWMYHVHGVALRYQIETRSPESKMVKVLDLVEPVVDEELVVQRHVRCILHDEIGLLLKVVHTGESHNRVLGRNVQPLLCRILLQSINSKRGNMGVQLVLIQEAVLLLQTRANRLLRARIPIQ